MDPIYDVDYYRRFRLLVILIKQNPKRPVRRLQAEALKYFPLESKEAQRLWLSTKTATKALNKLATQQTEENTL